MTRQRVIAAFFLAPAFVLLAALVQYPVGFTIWRSFFNASGASYVGLAKYREMFTNHSTLTAIKNNAVWVVVAPTLATSIGLVFAVLTERVRIGTAFKIVIFMPMAISFLAAGVIFRLVYDRSPDRGVANAILTGVHDVFRGPGPYPGARPSQPDQLVPQAGGFATTAGFAPGTSAAPLPLVAIPAGQIPRSAELARPAGSADRDAITGTVWLDFAPGGGGTKGVVDPGEKGLPGARVEAIAANGTVAGHDTTDDAGRFSITGLGADRGPFRLRLASSTFRPAWGGIDWLGPALVTPSIIGSFLWIWTGFAMIVIAAGLAAIPRETLEAARVDGASEWNVFRLVTVPLLWPVLLVVAVTLVINVLKIFDLVLVIPPGSVQDNANVVALELWRVSFGGGHDEGLGSALGVLLFVLVVPAMAFNVRRFRGTVDR